MTVFRRALEHGNLLVAEITAREIGIISLGEALELTRLIAERDPVRGSRASVRWLRRHLDEHEQATLDDIALIVSNLAALGGPHHDLALTTLRTMSRKATSAS